MDNNLLLIPATLMNEIVQILSTIPYGKIAPTMKRIEETVSPQNLEEEESND